MIKHIPKFASVFSNFFEEPIFIRNSNCTELDDFFVDSFNGLATERKIQMKLKFLKKDKSLKSKFNQLFSAPDQRRCPNEPVLELDNGYIEEEEGQDNTNKTESTYVFGGSLRRIFQSFPLLCFQQHKKTVLIHKRVVWNLSSLLNEGLSQ